MLVLGGTYALLGIGLTLIFGIMNVVNFTHGVLYTFGAYMMFMVVHHVGMNFFLALPVAIAAGWLLGALIELAAFLQQRLGERYHLNARFGYRHHHAGDERGLDRDAVRRAVDLGRRGEIRIHAISRRAAGAGTGIGLLAAAVRACRGGVAYFACVLDDQ